MVVYTPSVKSDTLSNNIKNNVFEMGTKMNKIKISVFLCYFLFLAGCASPGTMTKSQEVTLIGAAIGAAVGGAGGHFVGKMMDNQEKDMRDALATSEAAAVSREGNLLSVTFKGDVTFDTNSTELRTESYFEVNRIADILNKYPDTFIRVEGHTDSKGFSGYNMNLSKQRSNTVKTVLVQRGVDDSRIEVVGFGATLPVATNDTEAGRQKNRRVEIKIAPKAQTP